MTEDEMFAVMDGHSEALAAEYERIMETAPRCHMRKMMLESTDSVDGFFEQYWECSVCGHTKDF